jgi:integrase
MDRTAANPPRGLSLAILDHPPVLHRLPDATAQGAEEVGDRVGRGGLVFTRQDGAPYHPQYLTASFQRAAKKAGLPVLPLHSLRHGHATAGLTAGMDLTVMSRRLGHSSVAITANVYQHVTEELDRDAAEGTAAVQLGLSEKIAGSSR